MPSAVLASRSRSAWVGYSETMLAAWLRANTNSPRTQTVPTIRSRRSASRKSWPVPVNPVIAAPPSRVDWPLPAGVVTSSAW